MLEARSKNPVRWSNNTKQLPEEHIVYLNASADTRVSTKLKKVVNAA